MIISTIINFIIMNFCGMCYTKSCRVNVRSYSSAKIAKLLAPPKYD